MTEHEQVNWNSFTKAELIRTVKRLSARQTSFLNRIADMERERSIRETCDNHGLPFPPVAFERIE